MKTKVSIVDCDSYDNEKVYLAVKKSLDDIGFTFKKGLNVLLKPNILSQNRPEECITTHPAVIDAVCRILKENGCNITIGESSGFFMEGGTKAAFRISGIEEVAKKYNVKVVVFEESPVNIIKDDSAVILKDISISRLVFENDLIINLPKLKTHTLMTFTGAIKNNLGCMPGGLKQKCHIIAKNENDFGNLLLDLYKQIKPGLNIMDGIIGLEGDGPGATGIPKKSGIILASENSVALDIVAERVIGLDPKKIVTTRDAVKRKLFTGFDDVEIIGNFREIPYKKPKKIASWVPNFLKDMLFKQAMVYPLIDPDICKRCMVCVNVCPAKTIKNEHGIVFVDKKGCINCYCCHELCPHKAIELKSSKLIEFARKARDFLASFKKK